MGKNHISFLQVYAKYKKGLVLTKLEKELLILRLRKIEEIERIAEGDVELMEVANKLKELSLDINTVGFYDEAEEMEKMMNSLKAEGEMLGEKRGIKKGIKQGANNEKKSIAKNLLNIGIPKESIMQATGLNEAQIARLM